jgi:Domain of unknown function (DUF4382)
MPSEARVDCWRWFIGTWSAVAAVNTLHCFNRAPSSADYSSALSANRHMHLLYVKCSAQAARLIKEFGRVLVNDVPGRAFAQTSAFNAGSTLQLVEDMDMQNYLLRHAARMALLAGFIASLAACGGAGTDMNSSSASSTTTPSSAHMSVLMSDASSDDWATIGVKVQSIALTPQGGGSQVTVYTASPPTMVNLEELDQISEILANAMVPAGTYTAATLTLSANPGDVALTVAADPTAGFAAPAGTVIASDQIQIQGTQGAAGSLTVPVNVTFTSPLVVSAGQSNALQLEFDLAHPAFIIAHQPPGAGETLWAVDFRWPIRHRPIDDIAHLVLRHVYGHVTAVASDDTSITITKDLPLVPIAKPEIPVATLLSLRILADAVNGTIFYDVDAKTATTIKSFSTLSATLDGKFVRVAARYQEDGTLVAVRIWASSLFDDVWKSPEGHVLHVDTTNDVITVLNESGAGVPLIVDADTEFFFRSPADGAADATPIGTGTGFLTNMVRGFKVHASVVDPLATPLVAQTIDIESADYSGRIFAANTTGFTYEHSFRIASDDYMANFDYIASASANGEDADGSPITGFKFWDFAYPTLVTSGTGAIASFVTTTGGAVNFGGTAGSVSAWGVSHALWADAANPTGWSAPWTVLLPTPIPLGTIATAFANGTFAMTVAGGATPAVVDVNTASGSATLVYQVDRTGNVVTVSAIDVTTAGGMASLTAGLAVGAKVKVYGVPQPSGALMAYVLAYFTGTEPGI